MAKKEKTPPPAEAPKKEDDSQEAPAPAPKGGGKMKLIIIAVAALVVGMGGAVIAMKFMGGSPAPPPEAEVAAPAAAHDTDSPPPIEAPKRPGSEGAPASGHGAGGPEGEAGAVEAAGPINIEFKPFTVNLNDAGGKRYLKVVMSVEADSEALAAEINAKMPQFRDIILMLLSSLSYDDIATPDGKMRLRGQMLNRLNPQLSSGKIKNLYYSDFVVQ